MKTMYTYIKYIIIFLSSVHQLISMPMYDTIVLQHMHTYKRPVTVLEISNPINNIASYNLAKQFNNSSFVIFATGQTKRIYDECNANDFTNMLLLGRKASLPLLHSLSLCEHFDLTLCKDPEISFNTQTTAVLHELLEMGDYLFLAYSNEEIQTKNFVSRYTKYINTKLYDHQTSYNFVLLHKEKKQFIQKSVIEKKQNNTFIVHANFEHKKLFNTRKNTTTEWIPGINLLTFIHLRGQYPTKQKIIEAIEQLQGIPHNDINISNMIIKGTSVELIDFNDPAIKHPTDPVTALKECLRYLCQFKTVLPKMFIE